MDLGAIATLLLSFAVPILVFAALLLSVVRLLNAVEDSAKTLRRIERLLRDQQDGQPK